MISNVLLKELYDWRVKADYRPDDLRPENPKNVRDAIGLARHVIYAMDRAMKEPRLSHDVRRSRPTSPQYWSIPWWRRGALSARMGVVKGSPGPPRHPTSSERFDALTRSVGLT
jgi:hypothetical protein